MQAMGFNHDQLHAVGVWALIFWPILDFNPALDQAHKPSQAGVSQVNFAHIYLFATNEMESDDENKPLRGDGGTGARGLIYAFVTYLMFAEYGREIALLPWRQETY